MVRLLESVQGPRLKGIAMKCLQCTKPVTGEGLPFKDGMLCKDCAEKMESKPDTCPACGFSVPGDDAVAMLLTHATATPQQRMEAHSALVKVCPKCRVLFFDEFQYGILEGFRNQES